MNIQLNRKAGKFLESLQPKQFKQVATRVFDLCRDPRPQDMRHMEGAPGYFRITSGEYRVIYRTTNDIINIVAIGLRNDDAVYREFNRGV